MLKKKIDFEQRNDINLTVFKIFLIFLHQSIYMEKSQNIIARIRNPGQKRSIMNPILNNCLSHKVMKSDRA